MVFPIGEQCVPFLRELLTRGPVLSVGQEYHLEAGDSGTSQNPYCDLATRVLGSEVLLKRHQSRQVVDGTVLDIATLPLHGPSCDGTCRSAPIHERDQAPIED